MKHLINWQLATALIWIGVLALFVAGQLPCGIFVIITLWAVPQMCACWKGDN